MKFYFNPQLTSIIHTLILSFDSFSFFVDTTEIGKENVKENVNVSEKGKGKESEKENESVKENEISYVIANTVTIVPFAVERSNEVH